VKHAWPAFDGWNVQLCRAVHRRLFWEQWPEVIVRSSAVVSELGHRSPRRRWVFMSDAAAGTTSWFASAFVRSDKAA